MKMARALCKWVTDSWEINITRKMIMILTIMMMTMMIMMMKKKMGPTLCQWDAGSPQG